MHEPVNRLQNLSSMARESFPPNSVRIVSVSSQHLETTPLAYGMHAQAARSPNRSGTVIKCFVLNFARMASK
jgi:hypothetical protein